MTLASLHLQKLKELRYVRLLLKFNLLPDDLDEIILSAKSVVSAARRLGSGSQTTLTPLDSVTGHLQQTFASSQLSNVVCRPAPGSWRYRMSLHANCGKNLQSFVCWLLRYAALLPSRR